MSTGQIFLALGAIVLFALTAMNVNRSYVASLEEAVLIQQEMDAVQYGQSLADEVASRRADYATLGTVFANLDNVTLAARRRTYVTPSQDTLFATIEVAAEGNLLHGVLGKPVTVTVYSREGTTYPMRVRFQIPMVKPD